MKKKIFLGAIIALVCVAMFGCGKKTETYVQENMSEWTKVYYEGEGANFHVTLSSGEREKSYLVDGKSGENVDFALLTLVLEGATSQVVKINLSIDENVKEVELELAMNGQYMVDLERALTGNEAVSVEYAGAKVVLSNVSQNFAIDSKRAIEIASKELKDEIKACKSGSKLGAECYLRVLDKKINDFDKVYWCFSVVNEKGESHSVIISTEDGSVLVRG